MSSPQPSNSLLRGFGVSQLALTHLLTKVDLDLTFADSHYRIHGKTTTQMDFGEYGLKVSLGGVAAVLGFGDAWARALVQPVFSDFKSLADLPESLGLGLLEISLFPLMRRFAESLNTEFSVEGFVKPLNAKDHYLKNMLVLENQEGLQFPFALGYDPKLLPDLHNVLMRLPQKEGLEARKDVIPLQLELGISFVAPEDLKALSAGDFIFIERRYEDDGWLGVLAQEKPFIKVDPDSNEVISPWLRNADALDSAEESLDKIRFVTEAGFQPLEDILNLEIGSPLTIDNPETSQVSLWSGPNLVAKGRPAYLGERYGVEITQTERSLEHG